VDNNEYECSVCHGVFSKGWTDEEAEAERVELWPDTPLDECALTCDDCHKKFLVWFRSEAP
jgi:nitrate/TMAO reductase-like tetraheme cytochrome c subunit